MTRHIEGVSPADLTRPPQILIVDDQPMNVQVLAAALRADYRLKVALDGPTALEIAHGDDPPDLILLDVMMPGMDGYQVCRQLKGDPATSAIPIIFLTARGEVEDETMGLDLGAVDYITKPYHLAIVRARVRNHLKLKIKTDLLERLVAIDGLTGIPNRRRFDEALGQEWRRCHRERQPLAVVMLDVDHFKAYNDHYGHGAGDECLCRVARALTRELHRPADLLARYGGEEFVALLPETDAPAAALLAQRLCDAVAASRLPHAHSPVAPHVTISVGWASTPAVGEMDPAQLVKRADQALYRAKQQGRNQARGESDPA